MALKSRIEPNERAFENHIDLRPHKQRYVIKNELRRKKTSNNRRPRLHLPIFNKPTLKSCYRAQR